MRRSKHLVTPMDRYARSWMSFLQTNVCISERTPHAPSLMLQVAGRGYAELLRTLIRNRPKRGLSNSPKVDSDIFRRPKWVENAPSQRSVELRHGRA